MKIARSLLHAISSTEIAISTMKLGSTSEGDSQRKPFSKS